MFMHHNKSLLPNVEVLLGVIVKTSRCYNKLLLGRGPEKKPGKIETDITEANIKIFGWDQVQNLFTH